MMLLYTTHRYSLAKIHTDCIYLIKNSDVYISNKIIIFIVMTSHKLNVKIKKNV